MFRDTHAKGLPDLLLPFALVDDGVVLQNDGSLLAGWKYAGPDMETATYAQMAGLADRLNEALLLGSGWMAQANAIRSPAPEYPAPGPFPDPVTRAIDDERRQQTRSAGARFESEYFFTLTYLPPHKAAHTIQKWLYGSPDDGGAAAKALEVFEAAVDRFENVFVPLFRGERLKKRVVGEPGAFQSVYDDLLAYYSRCLDGEKRPFALPDIPAHLNDIIGAHPWVAGLEPCIDAWRDETGAVQGKHIAVIQVDGFPKVGVPGILAALDTLGIAYRWSTRAILLDKEEGAKAARSIARSYRATERGFADKIDLHSVKRTAEADAMEADAKEGRVQMCIYTSSIVLLNADRKALAEHARLAQKAMQEAGFSPRLEKINAPEAWLGTLPGEGYADVQRAFLNTQNLTDLLPVCSVWAGRRENPSSLLPKRTAPLIIAATTGSSQFNFNLHVQDVGHAMLIGPTGAGKSTILGLMAAQWFRYPKARVIAFDYGHSMWPLTAAVDGEFYAPGTAGEAGFCPLASLDEYGELAWGAEWLETLCELQDGPLSAVQKNRIAEGLRGLAILPADMRTLTHARAHIQDERVKTILEPWTGAGPFAYLFDEERLGLDMRGRFVNIETEHLMGLSEKALLPAILYLFHCVERSLDGDPTLLILDEARLVALSHPVFSKRLEKWLLTMRKRNCAVVFATQHLSHIAKSAIADVLIESCPTKIFLPNADAGARGAEGQKGPRDYYEDLGLNDREIALVSSMTPKRDYFITSPEGRRVVDFEMGPVFLAFGGVNGDEQRAALRATIARHGENWRAAWLRHKQLPDWADYLARLTERMSRTSDNTETEKTHVCVPDESFPAR